MINSEFYKTKYFKIFLIFKSRSSFNNKSLMISMFSVSITWQIAVLLNY